MPVYEFFCWKCKVKYEEVHEMGCYESICPVCGEQARHLISAASFNFGKWKEEWKKELDYANTPEP
ncbi:MAG: FmdB family zinc ribbon protein [Candidatus Hodarchaeota archaeon]